MNSSLRLRCLPLAALLTFGLSACGGVSDSASAPRQPVASRPPASASAPRPAALTKAQFVAKMEAVCTGVTAQLQQLPQHPRDIAGIAADLRGILTLYPAYLAQADALVNRSPDKAKLTRNWLSLEKSDFVAGRPVFTKFLADATAGKRTALVADAQALEALPDHSEAIAGFMSGYGMKSCAHLQSS